MHIALHEPIGHGTGNRILAEDDTGSANIDMSSPPIDPLTDKPIQPGTNPSKQHRACSVVYAHPCWGAELIAWP